jgi:hypothetical protein
MYIINYNRDLFSEERIRLQYSLRDKGNKWCAEKVILGIVEYSLKAKFQSDKYLDCFKVCNIKSSEDLKLFNFNLWERMQF